MNPRLKVVQTMLLGFWETPLKDLGFRFLFCVKKTKATMLTSSKQLSQVTLSPTLITAPRIFKDRGGRQEP